jgi:POT family proton-dependent oligopeptide transporter
VDTPIIRNITSSKDLIFTSLSNRKNSFILLLVIILLTASIGSALSILTLTFQKVFGFSRLYSVELFTTFVALLYCSSIAGGFFGGRLTSYATGVNVGVLLSILGSLGLYFHQGYFLIFSLALLVIGYGLISPCVISIFGQNLKSGENESRRCHPGFVLNYMSMNIGGVLGVGLSALWVSPSQYRNNFLFGILFLIGVLILFNYVLSRGFLIKRGAPTEKLRGTGPVNNLTNNLNNLDNNLDNKSDSIFSLVWSGGLNKFSRYIKKYVGIWAVLFLCVAILLVDQLLHFPFLADYFLISISFLTVGYVFFLGKKEDFFHFRRLIFFVFLTTVTILFFVLYNSEPDILTVFIEDHVNRNFLGFTIPSASYFMLNPCFNLIFGGLIFAGLKFFKKSFSPDIWIYSSIFFMGLGFWLLWVAIFFSPNGSLSTNWILLIYAVLSGAEMLLAPIAYEIVFLYGAPSLYGIMTGMSQLAIGLGAMGTERLSRFMVPKPGVSKLDSLHFFGHGFQIIGVGWMIFGIVLLLLTLVLKFFWKPRFLENFF